MKAMTYQKRANWSAELRRLRRRRNHAVPMAVYADGRVVNPAWTVKAAGKEEIALTREKAPERASNGEARLSFSVTNNN